MSDDYLWDRSGPPDPEIARLEELLRPFGQQQSVLAPTVRLRQTIPTLKPPGDDRRLHTCHRPEQRRTPGARGASRGRRCVHTAGWRSTSQPRPSSCLPPVAGGRSTDPSRPAGR